MKGFYIEVTNNLLEPKHRKNMGLAVWEFLWCLDKITKIDDDGVGWILGGKPINLKDIADDIGIHEANISRHINRLEKKGYIKIIHTPYGIVIGVFKAKKRFSKIVKPRCEIVKPNIRQYTDDNKHIISLREEASQNFNKKLFSSFKEIFGYSPIDGETDRLKYPRLIRQKYGNVDIEKALRWAFNLRSKDGVYYWRQNKIGLNKVYYKILPAYLEEVQKFQNLKRLDEMKKNIFKEIPKPTSDDMVEEAKKDREFKRGCG